MKKSKRIKPLIAAAAAIIIAIGTCACANPVAEEPDELPDSVVATVNGEPVAVDEMKMAMAKFRVETATFFYSKYGLDYTADFWETEVDSITPLEYIRQKSLDYIAERKVQQKFIRDKGVIGDFSYEAFLKDFEAENTRRQEAANQGGVIYGVESFDEITYYEYVFVNQVQSLLDAKGKELFPVSDEEIMQFYEKNKENFRMPDELAVDVIMVSYETDDAYGRIMEAQAALEGGVSFEDVMRDFNSEGEALRWDLSDETGRLYDGGFGKIAWNLSEGEVSGVFEWRSGWFIIRCAERLSGRYKEMEGREYSIMVECMWEKYNAFADEMRKEAEIVINEPVYSKLVMEM